MTDAETWIRQHTRSELVADAILHVLGLLFGLGALIALAAIALPDAPPHVVIGLAAYAFGMLTMFGCSALYNLTRHPPRRALFRRFDHAGIFVMIAGTYTPFLMAGVGGAWGPGLLGFVWSMALAGAALKLVWPDRFERVAILAYLLLGWSVLVAIRPVFDALSTVGITLLFAGGALYSIGVIFHLWERLRFQTAIWHGFVLAAAACHFAAVVVDVAVA